MSHYEPPFLGYAREEVSTQGARGTLRRRDAAEEQMKRVTGIGGIFFKAKDPAALQAWYKKHLGIDVQDWGGAAFRWVDAEGKPAGGTTQLVDQRR